MKNSEMEKIWTKLLKNIDYVRPNKGANLNPRDVIVREILIPSTFTEIQQVGIDVTVNDDVIIYPHSWRRAKCNEVVDIPKDAFGVIHIRSSISDKGVLLSAGVYDSGYRGIISFVLHNSNNQEILVKKDSRIAQIIFYHANSYCSYNGHNQNRMD